MTNWIHFLKKDQKYMQFVSDLIMTLSKVLTDFIFRMNEPKLMEWVESIKTCDLVPAEIKIQQLNLETEIHEDLLYQEVKKLNMRKDDEDFVERVLHKKEVNKEFLSLLRKICDILQKFGTRQRENGFWLTQEALMNISNISSENFNETIRYDLEERILKEVNENGKRLFLISIGNSTKSKLTRRNKRFVINEQVLKEPAQSELDIRNDASEKELIENDGIVKNVKEDFVRFFNEKMLGRMLKGKK